MDSVPIGKTAGSVAVREDVAAEDVPEVCAAEVLHEVSDEGDGGVDVVGLAEVIVAVHVAARDAEDEDRDGLPCEADDAGVGAAASSNGLLIADVILLGDVLGDFDEGRVRDVTSVHDADLRAFAHPALRLLHAEIEVIRWGAFEDDREVRVDLLRGDGRAALSDFFLCGECADQSDRERGGLGTQLLHDFDDDGAADAVVERLAEAESVLFVIVEADIRHDRIADVDAEGCDHFFSAGGTDIELQGFNLELRVLPLFFAHEVNRLGGDDAPDVLSLPVADQDGVRRQAGRVEAAEEDNFQCSVVFDALHHHATFIEMRVEEKRRAVVRHLRRQIEVEIIHRVVPVAQPPEIGLGTPQYIFFISAGTEGVGQRLKQIKIHFERSFLVFVYAYYSSTFLHYALNTYYIKIAPCRLRSLLRGWFILTVFYCFFATILHGTPVKPHDLYRGLLLGPVMDLLYHLHLSIPDSSMPHIF